jgi:hypothetical protein
MAEVITIVTGRIRPDRFAELDAAYREVIGRGLPPTLEDSFLLRTAEDQVAILSIWHRRADLESLAASGEEPVARRLIRTHGGEPDATFWEIVVRGRPGD